MGEPGLIPARFRQAVFVVWMTVLMGLALSAIFLWQERGFADGWGFLPLWLGSFARTYAIVLPVVIVVQPVAARLTALTLAPAPQPGPPRSGDS